MILFTLQIFLTNFCLEACPHKHAMEYLVHHSLKWGLKDGWFLKGCWFLNTLNISSGNQRDVATAYKENILPWMEGGWCGSVKDILPWTSPDQHAKELDTRSKLYPEWKRDGVVLWRIFYPEPLLISMLKSWIQGVSYTLNGEGYVWYLEGYSTLNLPWSGC